MGRVETESLEHHTRRLKCLTPFSILFLIILLCEIKNLILFMMILSNIIYYFNVLSTVTVSVLYYSIQLVNNS